MNLLIGSRALNYWYPDRKIKDTTDWDIISETPKCHPLVEWHDPEFLNNRNLAVFSSGKFIEFNGEQLEVCSPEGLAVIKRSHLWRSVGFGKHITDYHKYLKPNLDNASENSLKILQERTALSMKEFKERHPNLMQSKEDFFDDFVTKKYDHDYLHELFAYQDRPLYTRLLREANSAWCDKTKWETFSKLEKNQCVAEEVQVIATERFLVPNDWCYNSKQAYCKALEKVSTTLCSGWFRDHAIDNFMDILGMFNNQRFQTVKQKLN